MGIGPQLFKGYVDLKGVSGLGFQGLGKASPFGLGAEGLGFGV